MNKKSSAIKGLGIGLTVGAAMGIAGSYAMQSNKKLKKTAAKAIKSVSSAFANVQGMMK